MGQWERLLEDALGIAGPAGPCHRWHKGVKVFTEMEDLALSREFWGLLHRAPRERVSQEAFYHVQLPKHTGAAAAVVQGGPAPEGGHLRLPFGLHMDTHVYMPNHVQPNTHRRSHTHTVVPQETE